MAPISFKPKFTVPEPATKHVVLAYPAQGVLLARINRPKDLNCLNSEASKELQNIWEWLDKEPSFNCGIITGTGRAFCAGADLKGRKQYKCLRPCR